MKDYNWTVLKKKAGIKVAQDREKCEAPVNIKKNLRIKKNCGNMMPGWGTVSLYRMVLLI